MTQSEPIRALPSEASSVPSAWTLLVASGHQEGEDGRDTELVQWNQVQEDLVSMALVGHLDQDVPEVHDTHLAICTNIFPFLVSLNHYSIGW